VRSARPRRPKPARRSASRRAGGKSSRTRTIDGSTPNSSATPRRRSPPASSGRRASRHAARPGSIWRERTRRSCRPRVFRGERLSAAREGKKIKTSLERALALDPALTDAYFGIGLYHYYAGVAPAALKMLRWLLLLPGGDRQQGLREMQQAREQGALLRGEADYQLHWIYLWYEHQPERALQLLRSLDARYPSNPVFLQRIGEVEDEYFHDHRASADAWAQLIARMRSGNALSTRIASAYLSLGIERRHLGDRDHARDALEIAITLAPRDDADDVIARARSQIKNF
jgi:tetratricopeptide (TPR) repeat protein